MRILVAEDNQVNQTLARRILEKQGHTVTIVPDGGQAIQAFEQSTFDVILMDVHMPEMDGCQAKAIRQRESKGQRIPIIALTANAMSCDKERCFLWDGCVCFKAHERSGAFCNNFRLVREVGVGAGGTPIPDHLANGHYQKKAERASAIAK